MSIFKPLKVATPVPVVTSAVSVVVRAPPGPALFWMAKVTVWLVPVTGLLYWSRMVTAGCVAQAVPPVPPPGCVVKASFVAAPATTVRLELATPVSPGIEGVIATVSASTRVVATLAATPAAKVTVVV